MMTLAILVLAALALAFANGANDNFKGVATLFGSGTTSYRKALGWASSATFLGSITAVWVAEKLLKGFSGHGLVDDALTANPSYLGAVALGAGLTVLLATRIGMPISTTHSLVGALVGAAWAAGSAVDFQHLGQALLLPLLLSPLLAIALTTLSFHFLHSARLRLGITEQLCLCVGAETVGVVPAGTQIAALQQVRSLTANVGTDVSCRMRYDGRVLGVSAGGVLDTLHFLSAGTVSFARGLNDTPKLAALLLVLPQVGNVSGIAWVAVAMVMGGLLSARRVAETMSNKITAMNHGQGFTANLVTGLIVIGASKMGLPVSTTHVSCGSLFGLGSLSKQARWGIIRRILVAWLATLPAGAALGALAYLGIALM